MSIHAFVPQGNTVTFLAATAAPAAVQASGTGTSAQRYRVINAGVNLVFLGFGPTAAEATAAATVVTSSGKALPLLPGTDEILTILPNAWFTGITSTGTAQIYITPGVGV